MLTRYFVLNLNSGKLHTFRFHCKEAATAFYPHLDNAKQYFETKRKDTNGYLQDYLEHMYESIGQPRNQDATLEDDLRVADRFHETNFNQQDTLIICPELEQRLLYDDQIVQFKIDVDTLVSHGGLADEAYEFLLKDIVRNFMRRSED